MTEHRPPPTVEPPPPSLSPTERAQLRRGGGSMMPLGLILVALAFAIVLPRITEKKISPLRDELNEYIIPARERLLQIERELGISAYLLRPAFNTDRTAPARIAASQARRRQAEEDLLAFIVRLDGPDSAPVKRAARQLQLVTHGFDSVVALRAGRVVTSDSTRQQRGRIRIVRVLGDTIRAGIDIAAAHRRKIIAETERMASVLTGLSLLLGFGAALTVARFGRRFRAMALRLDESQDRLREIADKERAARAAAERSHHDLERVTESRTRLMRGFTHDVKNPLGAADGFLALVEERAYGEIPDTVRSAVSKVRQAIGQALELIKKLLDIARAEAGQLEIRRAKFEVCALVADVMEAFSAQAIAKNITLSVERPDDSVHLETDETRVRQILGNLVSNAVKYTPPGGHVVIKTVMGSDAALEGHVGVVVSVTDDGPGIPGDKRDLLFKEFTRLDPHVSEGAGVGLAISQKIAEALGGRITFESAGDHGSNFTLHLPMSVEPTSR